MFSQPGGVWAYRLAYRNRSGSESLVVNHSVAVGGKRNVSVAVRWYELRGPNGTPSVFQQGTFMPDASFRWMGSIAMDKVGDIALGYSVSSTSLFPSIRYTGACRATREAQWRGKNLLRLEVVHSYPSLTAGETIAASVLIQWMTALSGILAPL
jgi:hypothetical protein